MNSQSSIKNHALTAVIAALLCLLVALGCGIGGTFAALSDAQKNTDKKEYHDAKLVHTYEGLDEHSEGGENLYAYPGYTVERTESAFNAGTETMAVRINLNKYWADRNTDSSGKDNLTKTTDSRCNLDDIEVVLDDTTNWVDGGDGWYYYMKEIEPGATSTSLLKSVGIASEIGEERNDGKPTEETYGSVPSLYMDKAAVVEVDLQAVSTQEAGQAAFLSKTGDALSPLTIALFAAALIALLSCIVLFILAKKRSKDEEEQNQVMLA